MRYLASVEHELFWAGSTVKTACRQIRYAPEFKPPIGCTGDKGSRAYRELPPSSVILGVPMLTRTPDAVARMLLN